METCLISESVFFGFFSGGRDKNNFGPPPRLQKCLNIKGINIFAYFLLFFFLSFKILGGGARAPFPPPEYNPARGSRSLYFVWKTIYYARASSTNLVRKPFLTTLEFKR